MLYQRGIYPPEDFKVVKKYGLNVLVTTDDEVKSYIKRIMAQLSRNILHHHTRLISGRLDEGWQNLEIGYGDHIKRYRRGPRALAI